MRNISPGVFILKCTLRDRRFNHERKKVTTKMLSFVFFFKKTLFSTILKAPFGCAPRTIQSKICPIETHPYVRNATNYNRYLKSDIAESDFTRYCIPQIMP